MSLRSQDGVDGGAEDARLLDLRHRVERPHRRDRLGGADLENRPRGKDGLQLLDRAVRGKPAGLDDGHAVAVLGLVQVVRGDEDGDAGARQLVDQPPELPARQRIDTAGRLVEEHDRRLVENGAAEREPLAPAGRERAGERALAAAKTGHVEHEGAPRGEPIRVEPVDAAEERDVLIDGQLLVEREALRHVADAALDALGIAVDVDAADERRPGRGPQQAAQHADGGGLAGAVAAEEAEDLAGADVERHVVDGDEARRIGA